MRVIYIIKKKEKKQRIKEDNQTFEGKKEKERERKRENFN